MSTYLVSGSTKRKMNYKKKRKNLKKFKDSFDMFVDNIHESTGKYLFLRYNIIL